MTTPKHWLAAIFIVNGLMSLGCLPFYGFNASPFGYTFGIGLLAIGCAEIWLGRALLRNRPLARWLSLGPSLLMIIGAILSPLIVLMWLFSIGFLNFLARGRIDVGYALQYKFLAFLLLVWMIFCGVIGFRALKYLRSFEGRMEFVEGPAASAAATGILPYESRWMIIASAAVYILAVLASSYELTIHRESLPRFLMTAEMKAQEARERERNIKEMYKRVFITDDSRHIVVAPSQLQKDFLVVDLLSGKAQRAEVDKYFVDEELRRSISPDGASAVRGSDWVSLKDGDSASLKSLPIFNQIGFATPTTFLAYDSKSETLQLIDLEKDRSVYQVPVPQKQRGDGDSSYGWGGFSQVWSKDRARYAWMNRATSISILDVANGTVQQVSCQRCSYGQWITFTPTGDALVVPDPVSRSTDSPVPEQGAIYKLRTREWSNFEYRGSLQFVTDEGRYAAFWNGEQDTITYRDLSADSPHEWTLRFVNSIDGAYSRDGTLLHASLTADGVKHQFAGEFLPPFRADKMVLESIAPSLPEGSLHDVSRDGRYLLFRAGTKIEVVDLEAGTSGNPPSRTMDLLEDDILVATRGGAGTSWTALEAKWKEVPQPQVQPEAPADDYYHAEEESAAQDRSAPLTVPMATTVSQQLPEEPPPSGGILKCVDSAGTVTFTQVSCPPGTTRKDAPTIDAAPSQPYRGAPAPTRMSSNVIANSQEVPPPLRNMVKFGDRVTSSPMESVPCPGNPYAIRKPNRQIQQLSIHTGVYKHVITRENGGTNTVFVAGFPEQKVYLSRQQAVDTSCTESAEQAAKRYASGQDY